MKHLFFLLLSSEWLASFQKGIESLKELWEALLRGDDLVAELPADRGTLTSTTTPGMASPVGWYRGGPRSWTTLPASIVSSSASANVAQA